MAVRAGSRRLAWAISRTGSFILRQSFFLLDDPREVFEDELALAALERGIASAAYDLAIRRRACLGKDKLVLGRKFG